jgi:outer membrane murein-binding lipoprotein Lpp
LKNKKTILAATILLTLSLAGCSTQQITNNTTSNNDNQEQASAVEQVEVEDENSATTTSLKYYSSVEEAINALEQLEITPDGGDGSEYSSEIRKNEYGGWAEYSGWNTREQVLLAQATTSENDGKAFTSGTWYIPYTGETITCETKEEVSKKLQIDHIIPVGYVQRHGGSSWSQDKKQEYYNDYGEDSKWTSGANDTCDYENAPDGILVVSDSSSNISKSDSGPSDWMPSNKDYWVEYCETWVKIASTYGISLDQSDHDKILEVLETAR